MATVTKKIDAANLAAIRRIDPFVEEVLARCPHTALFNFNTDERKWVKGEVEGPLLVYRRKDKPFFSWIIANRLSLDDHIEPILKEGKLKYEPPYIFVYGKDDTIRGLWFGGEDECKRVYNLFTIIRKNLTKTSIPNLVALIKAESTGAEAATASSPSDEGETENKVQDGTRIGLEELGISGGSAHGDQEEEEADEEGEANGDDDDGAETAACNSTPVLKTFYTSSNQTTPKTSSVPIGHAAMNSGHTVVGLSREQLLQGILHLLKNDPSFLDRIHQGYYESLQAHLGGANSRGGKK